MQLTAVLIISCLTVAIAAPHKHHEHGKSVAGDITKPVITTDAVVNDALSNLTNAGVAQNVVADTENSVSDVQKGAVGAVGTVIGTVIGTVGTEANGDAKDILADGNAVTIGVPDGATVIQTVQVPVGNAVTTGNNA